jgi:hypothetical protein
MARSGKYRSQLAAHESGAKNADTHVLSVWLDLNALCDSTFLDNTFLAIKCVLHMLVEEREDFFRMPSEVVVAILKASRCVFNPMFVLAPRCKVMRLADPVLKSSFLLSLARGELRRRGLWYRRQGWRTNCPGLAG